MTHPYSTNALNPASEAEPLRASMSEILSTVEVKTLQEVTQDKSAIPTLFRSRKFIFGIGIATLLAAAFGIFLTSKKRRT